MHIYLGQRLLATTRWLPLLGLALLVGCQQPALDTGEAAAPSIKIAVCNMDEVAKELGFLQQMDKIFSNRQAQLTAQVQKIQQQGQEAVNRKIEEIGKDPDEEQKKQLAQLQAEAMQNIRNAQSAANKILNRERTSLIQQIRTKIKVPIDKVAKEKGIHIVMTQHPDLLVYTAGAADITGEVISAARAAEMGVLDPETSPPDGGTQQGASETTNGGRNESSELRAD